MHPYACIYITIRHDELPLLFVEHRSKNGVIIVKSRIFKIMWKKWQVLWNYPHPFCTNRKHFSLFSKSIQRVTSITKKRPHHLFNCVTSVLRRLQTNEMNRLVTLVHGKVCIQLPTLYYWRRWTVKKEYKGTQSFVPGNTLSSAWNIWSICSTKAWLIMFLIRTDIRSLLSTVLSIWHYSSSSLLTSFWPTDKAVNQLLIWLIWAHIFAQHTQLNILASLTTFPTSRNVFSTVTWMLFAERLYTIQCIWFVTSMKVSLRPVR